MSFSGGVYTLPGPALVTGEVVSATENNQFRNDVAGAFNLTFLRNGTSTATANLPMGGYKLTGLGAPTTNGDALSYGAAAVVTTLTSTSLTATRVPYAGTGGLLQDASTFTFDGTTLTAGGFTTSGAISAGTITASGAITVSGGTDNGVAYLNGSKVLTTGSALTFDGTTLSSTKFAGALNGTVGATTPAAGTFTSLSDSGNLTFTGTGNRITGDFSNATVANRVTFQTTTSNSTTSIQAMPNGTSNSAGYIALNSSSDLANCSFGSIGISSTDARIQSSITGTGTYLPMTFYTGGSERMRIDSSGNVGIGTSSPAVSLDVQKATNAQIRAKETGAGVDLRMNATGGAGLVGIVGTYSNHPVVLYTNTTERMRIDTSGNLLVGTTSNPPAAGFVLQPDGRINWGTSSGSGKVMAVFYNGGTNVGNINTNGTSTTYATSSDYRLKENIQPMQNALGVVAQLNPVTYTWKADGSDGQGFIAHELQAVVPYCVTGEKDAVRVLGNIIDAAGKVVQENVEQPKADALKSGEHWVHTKDEPVYQGIDTSFLVATLAKAVQELKAELDATKAEVAALKGN